MARATTEGSSLQGWPTGAEGMTESATLCFLRAMRPALAARL